jgi:hypothetical protein
LSGYRFIDFAAGVGFPSVVVLVLWGALFVAHLPSFSAQPLITAALLMSEVFSFRKP